MKDRRQMEYDDLHEPAETTVRSQGLLFGRGIEPHIQRHSPYIYPVSVASNITRFYSQPEVRTRTRSDQVETYLNSTVVQSETRNMVAMRAPVRRSFPESISLLRDLPVPVKLEDDLGDLVDPFRAYRLRLRMRDDLDEPLTQPPPQRTRLELVDDLDEPEDVSEESETEFHDDLHELVEPRQPAGMSRVDGLHDDLNEPIVDPPSDPRMNEHALLDDLEEPVATRQPSHRELLDDLDDPVETGQGSPPRAVGSNLDHLYDDLDELLVDELISEVSDLVLQGRNSVRGRGEQDRENLGGPSETSSANSASTRSSAHHAAKSPLHSAHFPQATQGENSTPHLRRNESKLSERLVLTARHLIASEQTTIDNANSTSSSEISISVEAGSIVPDKGSQMTRQVQAQQSPPESIHKTRHVDTEQRSTDSSEETQYAGLQTAVEGPRCHVNKPQSSSSAVLVAGDVPKRLSSSQVIAAEARTSSSRSANNSDKRFTGEIRIDVVGSQSARGCPVQSQLCQSNDNPKPMHSNTPASSRPMSSATHLSAFAPRIAGSQLSPPPSPLLLPRSSSHGPSASPSSQSEVIPPPALLSMSSGTPSHHHKPPTPPPMAATALPQHIETSAPCPPINDGAPLPLPHKETAEPPSPVTPATSTAPAHESCAPVVRLRPASSRGARRAVQTETVVARIDALLAAVTACRQRGETPELVLPAKTRWRDLQLCSA